LIHVSVTISPIKNVEGRIIGASKIERDITKGKQAQETQALLIGEMRHRVNNPFAVTNALVGIDRTFSKNAARNGGGNSG